MMKAFSILLVTVLVVVLIERTSVSAAPVNKKYVLRGKVTCNGTTKIPAKNATCTVQLLEESLTDDAPARVINQSVSKALQFPITYSIPYTAKDLEGGLIFVLQCTIYNAIGKLLYITKTYVPINPMDTTQISSKEVPVDSA